jgi:hypothetical protein
MSFEMQHSLFFYSKRPDIQNLLVNFDKIFGTSIELTTAEISKEFNPMYLSHNRF